MNCIIHLRITNNYFSMLSVVSVFNLLFYFSTSTDRYTLYYTTLHFPLNTLYKSIELFKAPFIIAETGPGGGFVSLPDANFVGDILSTNNAG